MTTLGKYELHEILGRGGFGTVYRAIDTSLQREVALKVLHPQLTTDPDFLEKFRNEARLVAGLRNPNIVTIFDLGEADGRVFIAMDYLPGGSLKQKLEKEGALAYDEAREIVGQICNGLKTAHKKGLVHRDIKPGNILFDAEGNAVIGDFGLARAIQLSSTSAASSTGGVGTPAYRAPELWIGKPPASPATDIYSLGCVFSEMLTGKELFEGDTTEEILAHHLNLGPSLPETYPAGAPSSVHLVIERAVKKEVTERYQTAAEFEHALAEAEEHVQVVEQKQQTIPEAFEPLPVEVPAIPEKSEDGLGDSKLKPAFDQKPKRGVWLGIGAGLAMILLLTIGGLSGLISPKISAIPPDKTEGLDAGSTMVSQMDGMTMVYVPAGKFTMGSPDGVGESDEHPQHQVYLDAYWIDQTEVTNAMYEKCVKDGGCTEPLSISSYYRKDSYYGNSQYADYPVIYVNWNQAHNYCEWAGRQLPTEAQWEKAARGTDGRTYPWGNESPNIYLASFNGNVADTTEAGAYPDGASPYGALDMAGNVWEWVADWDGDYPSGMVSNPTGPVSGNARILRGGSGNLNANYIRSAVRFRNSPSSAYYLIGFRCACLLQ